MVAITKVVRRISKTLFFILTSVIVARLTGSPERWFNHDLAVRMATFFYGNGEIGADNFYTLYFYVSVATVFTLTAIIYVSTMTLIRIKRK
ncbi:hypothetical protein CIG19_02945 [Enterobacterales bacterium CwR94]|nr:hypothetical protein CIG19_02945 [Enterobacterales bacterium CwR94]